MGGGAFTIKNDVDYSILYLLLFEAWFTLWALGNLKTMPHRPMHRRPSHAWFGDCRGTIWSHALNRAVNMSFIYTKITKKCYSHTWWLIMHCSWNIIEWLNPHSTKPCKPHWLTTHVHAYGNERVKKGPLWRSSLMPNSYQNMALNHNPTNNTIQYLNSMALLKGWWSWVQAHIRSHDRFWKCKNIARDRHSTLLWLNIAEPLCSYFTMFMFQHHEESYHFCVCMCSNLSSWIHHNKNLQRIGHFDRCICIIYWNVAMKSWL